MNRGDDRHGVHDRGRRARSGERGVSFTVSYVVTLAITVVLVAGILLAAGQVVGDQRERTVRDQATVVGDKVAAAVMAADRLVRAGNESNVDATVGVDLPERFVDEPYVVELTDGSPPAVVVRTNTPPVSARVPLRSDTALEPTTVTGGPVQVTYLPDEDALTLEEVER